MRVIHFELNWNENIIFEVAWLWCSARLRCDQFIYTYCLGLYVEVALLQLRLNTIRLITTISPENRSLGCEKGIIDSVLVLQASKKNTLRDRIVVVQLRSAITIHRIKSYNIRAWQRFIHGKHNLTFFFLLSLAADNNLHLARHSQYARDPDQSLAAAAPQQINA